MRIAVLLLLVVALAPLGAAQIVIAPKAGLNVAWWAGDDSGEPDPRLGLVAGISVQAPLQPVGVMVEALYSQKGIKVGDESLAFDYAELALLGRYAIPASELVDIGLSAGPWVGIPVSTDLDVKTDFGVALGVDVGSGPFYVEARFDVGLTNIPDTNEDLSIQNQSVAITAGYRIGQ